jgi:hypothetical protein
VTHPDETAPRPAGSPGELTARRALIRGELGDVTSVFLPHARIAVRDGDVTGEELAAWFGVFLAEGLANGRR